MNEEKLCTICNQQKETKEEVDDGYIVSCSRCGKYKISQTSYVALKSRIKEAESEYPHIRYFLSHWLRNQFIRSNTPSEIGTENINSIISKYSLPDLDEQCVNLMLFLGENIFPYSDFIRKPLETWEAIIGTAHENDLLFLQRYLYDQGFLRISGHDEDKLNATKAADKIGLTFKGWDRYNELRTTDEDSNYAFMAMEYKDAELNEICEKYFKSAVAETGFELRLLRDYPKAGIIDNHLRISIRRCKFLLADLTHDNNGAYWEAGYAEGLGKAVIYLCEKEKFEKEKTHFDTNHCTTIPWDKNNMADFKENLKATIRSTFPLEARMQD